MTQNTQRLTIDCIQLGQTQVEATQEVLAASVIEALVNEIKWQRTLAVRRFNKALESDATSDVLNKLQSETDRLDRVLKLAGVEFLSCQRLGGLVK